MKKGISLKSIPKYPINAQPVFRVWQCVSAAVLALICLTVVGCGPEYSVPKEPEVIRTEAPKISYKYDSDEALLEANNKARIYCSQYASTPNIQGTIIKSSEDSKSVTFECVKAGLPTPQVIPSTSCRYLTDEELLQSMQSADIYCARLGKIASTTIVVNPDSTKSLNYQCIPRESLTICKGGV